MKIFLTAIKKLIYQNYLIITLMIAIIYKIKTILKEMIQ